MNSFCVFKKSRCVAQANLPLPLRAVSWMLVFTQVMLPFNNEVWAAMNTLADKPHAAARENERKLPDSSWEPQFVNRTIPKVTQPPLVPAFSQNPTDKEIFEARAFAEPLVPTGKTTVAENRKLANAISAFLQRTRNDDVSALSQFLEEHPASPWRATLLANLGVIYKRAGYFTKALETLSQAWEIGGSASDSTVYSIVNGSVGELAELIARLGQAEQLETVLAKSQGRNLFGPSTEKISGARELLWRMKNEPETTFLCGPTALRQVALALKLEDKSMETLLATRASARGMSLLQLWELSKQVGMNLQMAKRSPGSKLPLPAVIHWKSGHYAAILKESGGMYQVMDATFNGEAWLTEQAIESEGSGFFLVGRDLLPSGWELASDKEAAGIWGRGPTGTKTRGATTEGDNKVPCQGASTPMAQYAFHTMLVSLNIVDTPISYSPPRGPAINFKVTYNQREYYGGSAYYAANMGPKWIFHGMSYIIDDPLSPLSSVVYVALGGGSEPYSQFDTNTQSFAIQPLSQTRLVRTSSTSYERRHPDGSKEVFSLPNGAASYPRTITLTKLVDPSGNAVSYTYDGNFRLVAITDAIGQTTTLSYDLAADSLKVTKVTDPFGRFATFDYTQIGGVWRLTKITDPIAITSEFTYDGDFITSLKTPYGTTTFAAGESGPDYWLEATDPLGAKERLEFYSVNNSVTNMEPFAPTNMSVINNGLTFRTSYYWDKKAMQEHPGDYTKARSYHWLHSTIPGECSNILESEKKPLESRVYYNYPGQSSPIVDGTNALPSAIGRVLDDGSSQVSKFEYNLLGRPTKVIDPVGRTTLFTYDTNFIDLLQIRQVTGATNDLLATFVYSTNHLPIRVVDASNRTNFFGYNVKGQLTSITNAKNETVTLNYDNNGYLTNITGALPGATTSFTYDSAGRVRTVTDSEGYTITSDYDNIDRPTKVTYPDGTYEQVVYKYLDPVLRKDRRGHWSSTVYDPLRRITDVQDALNRVTHFEWCGCGSLESFTDPMGRITSWVRDLQGRPTAKIYPDGTQYTYGYETNSGRLKVVTDAKSQATVYDYFTDSSLKQVSYTNAVIATPSVNFNYDTNYNRIVSMVDGVGTNLYSYYPYTNGLGAGCLLSLDGPFPNDTITYQYDELGRMTNRAINGVAQNASFDALGRVTKYTNALGSFTNTYVNATMRLATNFYPNGQKTILSYYGATNDFRLQQIFNMGPTNQLSAFSYAYDPDGQITHWTQQADGGTPKVMTLEYDPVDQLLAATVRSNGIAGAILKNYVYAYDKLGNRTSEQVDQSVTTAAHNNLNQLTSTTAGSGPMRFAGSLNEVGTVAVAGNPATMDLRGTGFVGYASVNLGTNTVSIRATDFSNNTRTNIYQLVVTNSGVARTLSYDLNGNLTNLATANWTNSYEWDAANRLIRITQATPTNMVLVSEFGYDGLGRRTRIVERTNGVVQSNQTYQWCEARLWEQRDLTGGTTTKRFFERGERLGDTNYFFSMDHLNSVREVSDSSGAIIARFDYDLSGQRQKISGALEFDFAFTGHFLHKPTQTYLTLNRSLDPSLGLWLSRDPLGEGVGLNPYTYVKNNSINLVDPFGLLEANSAHEFWMSVAVNGETKGGIAGHSQAAAAAVMTSFIEFFGAQAVENHASTSGTAAGNGETGKAILYGAATVGDIGLAALAGWTGGGGAAAKGVKLSEVGWYELGSQTIKGEVFKVFMDLDKVALGKALVEEFGWMEALLKRGILKPTVSDWVITLKQGPTPGGYIGMMLARLGLMNSISPCN